MNTPLIPESVMELGMQVTEEMDREFHESPDRVIAVIGAAYLDAMLERLFRSAFIENDTEADRLLRPDAPLGSNGSRYQLAYCLGLITKDQRDDLRLIGRIRNTFAHDFKATGFDTEPIRSYCSSLKQPIAFAEMPKALFDEKIAKTLIAHIQDTTISPREKYRTSVFQLFGSLLRRLAYIRRSSPSIWFTYDPDSAKGPSGPAANT